MQQRRVGHRTLDMDIGHDHRPMPRKVYYSHSDPQCSATRSAPPVRARLARFSAAARASATSRVLRHALPLIG